MRTNSYAALLFWVTLLFVLPACFSKNEEYDHKIGNDDTLFLTPYIETGRIEEAQQLATVAPMLKNVESFAGYLTVNKTSNSNLFFWLFKSQQGNWKKRPLVVWLQGGLAQTSLYGLFRDVGPYFVNKDRILKRRKYSWNRKCNLVFIDNPVGAGFSFTETDYGYPADVSDVTRDLYEALLQLHKLFPTFKENKLVITGESYGTKYAVALAHKICRMNQASELKLKVNRLILASAFSDPASQVKYSSYLYNLGLVDGKQQQDYFHREEDVRADIKAGDFASARETYATEVRNIKELTGLKSDLDFVHDDIGLALKAGAAWFLNRTETKRALHVGDHRFEDNQKTIAHLQGDFMQSVKPLVEDLLKAKLFPVLFLNGQLDISAAYSLELEFFRVLEWPHAKEYYTAKRCQFRVRRQVAGYYKSVGTFTEVLVRNTGHLIAASEPKWTLELVDKFIANSNYFQCV